jgi:GH24 family phage-related lysozyme (muramidase)
MNTWIKRLTIGGGLLAASVVGVVKHNEGYSERTYYDGAGVATICYGETKGVKPGQVRTKSQCDKQLQESLTAHAKVFDGIPASTPDVVALGVLDMAYNIGVTGFNNSKIKKAIIKGDYKMAGQYVLEWKYITRNGKKSIWLIWCCCALYWFKPSACCSAVIPGLMKPAAVAACQP